MIDKEVSDALHMLLHCALKDKEFETQKEQFHIVYNYIELLEKERDYYKERYLEFNNAFIQGGKKLMEE